MEVLEAFYNLIKNQRITDEILIVEKALNDFEWLLSKIDIDFFGRLPTEDKLRLAKIMGMNISYE